MRTMVRTLVILFVIGSGSLKAKGTELRVLFVGNSYTSQIQGALNNLTQSSPYSESTFEYIAPDGWTLKQHLDSENTMSKIRSQAWDFVVLQEQSQIPTLPDRCNEFYDAVAQLSEVIKESGAQVVLYMTWGRRDYDSVFPQINPDYDTMQQRLIEAYTKAARNVDAIIAPVGIAWQRVRRNNPDLGRQLYHSDGSHPSYKGAFLIACVFYATLFDADPTELAFNGGLSVEEAAYLSSKAKEAFIPNVDFNGDEIVNFKDYSKLAQYWLQDESSVDIAPLIGNGTVNTQDVAVLADHWLKEVLPVSLLAYWKLDETEGSVAYDSVGDKDSTLRGDPLWEPTTGKVGGALRFDGIDDYVSTPSVLNPAEGVFSVFAWIKGGAPGQVVVSQEGGANWLCADPSEGKLMTSLSRPPGGRFSPEPLVSEFIIPDGGWHRVGLVWDGSDRILFVDDIEVARDTQSGLAGSDGGLYLGAGANLEAGTFFSGLIDDVRVYNQAVTP